MLNLLKSFFRPTPSRPASSPETSTDYNGFTITPHPRHRAHGWSTEALITKRIDDHLHQHTFIRADASTTREDAISLTLTKAKTLIDQRGNTIFPSPPNPQP